MPRRRSWDPTVWSAWWNLALAVLAFASLGIIAYVELAGLRPRDPRFRPLAAIDLAIVLILAGDLAVSFARAESKGAWLRARWYEIPGLVPLYAELLSFLRIAQLARLLRVLRLLRAASGLRRARSAIRFLDALFNRGKLGHTLLTAGAIVVVMALGVWLLERDTNPRMATFGEALWWAIVTSTTVGYGDITPQSALARMLATVLMLLGIGTVGIVASTMSTALLAEREGDGAPPPEGLVADLERLVALRERGALTEGEFAEAKRRLLA